MHDVLGAYCFLSTLLFNNNNVYFFVGVELKTLFERSKNPIKIKRVQMLKNT